MAERYDVDALLQSIDIVTLVGRYCELTKKGHEFVTHCIDHSPDNNPSMYVSPQKGFVHCFSCGYHADAIGFVMKVENLEFREACAKLSNGHSTDAPVRPAKQRTILKQPARETFPPPVGTPLPDMALRGIGEPSKVWTYKTPDGDPWGYVARYETKAGKEIRQWTWGRRGDTDTPGWACGHFSHPRPLYGLEELVRRPSTQVLLVEGEKTTDAARRLFPQMVSITWPGGAQGIYHVDWSPLRGMKVVLLPDNDEPGRTAMARIAMLLHAAGAAEVKGIAPTTLLEGEETPEGWDLADAADWTPADALSWAKAHLFLYPATQAEKAAAAADAPRLARVIPDGPPTEAPADAALLPPSRRRNGKTPVPVVEFKHNESAESLGILHRRLSDVEFRPIDWLWQDRIPCGKVSMIVGNPGLGKSQVAASLAAVVTTGGRWPVSRDSAPAGNVIILSAEDDADDTIGPRMEAAGADTSRIHILDAIRTIDERGEQATRGVDLCQDISRLMVLMREIGNVKLVVIDPISAYLGAADSHNNAEVRGVLAPLKDAASKVGAAIIIVSHLNKSQGQEALLRTQGSVGFIGAARAVWGVAKDKDNPQRRLFMPLKNNLGTDTTGLAYSIESHQLADTEPAIHTSRILWETSVVNMSPEEVFSQVADEERTHLTDAKYFLQDLLGSGNVETEAIQIAARKAGHSWSTVRRAKDQLKILSVRGGGFGGKGKWVWALPAKSVRSYADKDD